MNSLLLLGILASIFVVFWIIGAFMLGRQFGQQEARIERLRSEHVEYTEEVLQQQQDLEDAWAKHSRSQEGEYNQAPSPAQPSTLIQHIRPVS